MKQYGTDLKRNYKTAQTKLKNAESAIEKRFELIVNEYIQYLTDDDKKLLLHNSIHDLSLDQKVSIIINTEDKYNQVNSKQLGFNF